MQPAQKLKTTKDLLALPDQTFKVHELLEGEIFVSEHPSLNHQRLIGNLIFLLDKYLMKNEKFCRKILVSSRRNFR